MALWKVIVTLMLIGYLTAGLAGCGQENSAERAGQAVDQAVGDAKKTGTGMVNQSTDAAKSELERVKKKINEGATQK